MNVSYVNVTLAIVTRRIKKHGRFRTLRKSYLLNSCRLSQKQAKASTRHHTCTDPSETNITMSEARNEPSKHLGSSCEDEITNGIHCHTERYQDSLKCPTNIYDSFETADRIKKA